MYGFDKDTVKQLDDIYRVISFIVVPFMVFVFFYYGRPFESQCKKHNELSYDLELLGSVYKKLAHSSDHNLPRIEFPDGKGFSNFFLEDKLDKISIGDSIVKQKKSYDFYIIKKDTTYKFNLYENCDSLKN